MFCFVLFFGLLLLHLLHPCPKSDQSANPAGASSLASLVPILPSSSPWHMNLGPQDLKMGVSAIEILPLHFFPQQLTLLRKLFLRPSKLILLIHQLQELQQLAQNYGVL